MQTFQVLRSKVQLLLYHSLLHLNLGTAIHLPLCSKPSCASSYKARFPDSDTVGGSEQRHEATCDKSWLSSHWSWWSGESSIGFGTVSPCCEMSSWVTFSSCSCRPLFCSTRNCIKRLSFWTFCSNLSKCAISSMWSLSIIQMLCFQIPSAKIGIIFLTLYQRCNTLVIFSIWFFLVSNLILAFSCFGDAKFRIK